MDKGSNETVGHGKLDVVTLGEVMLMLVNAGDGVPPDKWPLGMPLGAYVGGAEGNVAVALAGLGLKAGLITRLGKDMAGEFVHAHLKQRGVDLTHALTSTDGATGLLVKNCAGGSEPRVDYHRKVSAASQMTTRDYPADYVRSARHLHATGILPALSASTDLLTEHAMKEARRAGLTVSFDFNLRKRLWSSTERMIQRTLELARLADFVMLGRDEALVLTQERTLSGMAQVFLDGGASVVVIRAGAEGAYVQSRDGLAQHVPALRVKAVDPIGAGDSHAAGVMFELLTTGNPLDAVKRGNQVASEVVQRVGDW